MGRERTSDQRECRGCRTRRRGPAAVSAHPVPERRSWLSALVAQVSEYVFEEVEDAAEPEPIELKPRPVIAVVSAHARSGASTVARLLGAELAIRGDGSALVWCASPPGRGAPGARPAMRLATAMRGAATVRPSGRLCFAGGPAIDLITAGRYLAPIVLDVPPNGTAAEVTMHADRLLVVAGAEAEPALLEAVASILGDNAIKIANRVGARDDADAAQWKGRADALIPDARMGARAAAMGTRARGPLGTAIAEIADALELDR